MRILFIADGKCDFLHNAIFHGARTLLGENVIDDKKLWHLYDSCTDEMWNKGMHRTNLFTLFRKLSDLNVDRTNISQKILDRYFDKIIYGNIHRNKDYMDEVTKSYNRNDIIMLDGEDHQEIDYHMAHFGRYYKRELITPCNQVSPIGFSIPEELIVPIKYDYIKKDRSTMIPKPNHDQSSYIYTNEDDYYNEYKHSKFAMTHRKGGWDCLRHYEILMNGCIPLFPDLSFCPKYTMTRFPKRIIAECNRLYLDEKLSESDYNEYREYSLDYTRNFLTTTAMFQSLI
jgi:hypothetical protein